MWLDTVPIMWRYLTFFIARMWQAGLSLTCVIPCGVVDFCYLCPAARADRLARYF